MSAKMIQVTGLFSISFVLPFIAISAVPVQHTHTEKLHQLSYQPSQVSMAVRMGWVVSDENYCGGYYLEPAFRGTKGSKAIQITGKKGLIAQKGTSSLTGDVDLSRYGQEIKADQALIYRDKSSFQLTYADLTGHVLVREPNTLILADTARYHFRDESKAFENIYYRTMLVGRQVAGPVRNPHLIKKPRKLAGTVAWGKAKSANEKNANVYEFQQASFSTCPPVNPSWRVKASHIVLDKNSGRGYATHARLLVRNVPVLYLPYLNFSIDGQRKTGFLWPVVGASNKWGPSLAAPYYFNLAPNYDDTLTPALLMKRGVMLNNEFRYLTEKSHGNINLGLLPSDKAFAHFKKNARNKYADSSDPVLTAELSHLLNANDTRQSLSWQHHTGFSPQLSADVDFNYVGDDYYLRDFSNNVNAITDNQLLQQADLSYKSLHWQFLGRIQAYQTLHPIDESLVMNQYRRLPQLSLSMDYPDQAGGLDYFFNSELTHFEYVKTPGVDLVSPNGNRAHFQPGLSLPINLSYFNVTPRLQLALTSYNLANTHSNIPRSQQRAVPIFDVSAGLAFNRDTSLFNHDYQQTLEPQIYYTYIPYRDQTDIPLFDTTVNTLTYDQLFNYNRFTGIDRIGDANQVSVGLSSRFIDKQTGYEKVRLGLGEIVYFANRRVTQCNDNSCSDNPENHSNYQRLSPLTATIDYHISNTWLSTANVLWNPVSKQMENASFTFHFQPVGNKIINLGFSYVRQGDVLSGIKTNDNANNLKLTDTSFAWPITDQLSAVGRWSENLNHRHLQNLLYGLQYDTCCWQVRLVGGRAFTNYDSQHNNRPQYNSEVFLQFALKGLGNIQSGNADSLLASITGYQSQMG